MTRTNLGWVTLLAWLLIGVSGATAAEDAVDPPHFKVVPRDSVFEASPCEECHADLEPNPKQRVLEDAPHFAAVRHGQADIWCTTCHSLNPKRSLKTLTGEPVAYDESYRICSQCHARIYRDWQFGAHGKRVTGWRSQRVILSCTACHNPHLDRGARPRRPDPPPGVRAGLQHQHQHRHRAQHRDLPVWESHQSEGSDDADVPQ